MVRARPLAWERVGLEKQVNSRENRTCGSSGVFSNARPGQGFARGFSIPERCGGDGPGVGSHPVHTGDPSVVQGRGWHCACTSRDGVPGWGAPLWGYHSGAGGWLPSHFQNPGSKAASGETVGACCELSFRTSSEDASQAFSIAGKSSSAVEKLARCFLFILFYF